MKSIKSAAIVIAAIVFGYTLGTYFSHPPQVQAGSLFIHVQKVQEGNTVSYAPSGSQFLGFACTQQDCYIASR
jgi:hypothetical protein